MKRLPRQATKRLAAAVALAGFLAGGMAWAGKVQAILRNNSVSVKIEGLGLPLQNLEKDLKSGFTTTLLVRADVRADSKKIATKEMIITVFYDLWDEVFKMTKVLSGGHDKRVLKSVPEVIAQLNDLEIPDLLPASALNGGAPYVIEVAAFLDPIQKDRALQIQKYIAEKRVGSGINPVTGGTEDSWKGAAAGASVISAIFEEYLDADVASLSWKTTLTSAPFKKGDF